MEGDNLIDCVRLDTRTPCVMCGAHYMPGSGKRWIIMEVGTPAPRCQECDEAFQLRVRLALQREARTWPLKGDS